ncbi:MAG: hypothetical protein MJ252_07350 [archaeon]|nr:hypothetical protein [archaeon]
MENKNYKNKTMINFPSFNNSVLQIVPQNSLIINGRNVTQYDLRYTLDRFLRKLSHSSDYYIDSQIECTEEDSSYKPKKMLKLKRYRPCSAYSKIIMPQLNPSEKPLKFKEISHKHWPSWNRKELNGIWLEEQLISKKDSIEEEQKIPKCIICLDIPKNPYKCSNCKQVYCYNCLRKYSGKCPIRCKHPTFFKPTELMKDLAFLKFRCQNGCGKIIKYNELEKHYISQCPNRNNEEKKE